MGKISIEFDTTEAVKLIAICNAAIISEEETLRCYDTLDINARERTKNSLEKIWEIKNKIKKTINDRYRETVLGDIPNKKGDVLNNGN